MWIAAYAGEIVAVGHGYEVRERLDLDDGAIIIDAAGLVAVPGPDRLPHARLLSPATASTSSSMRSRGASYEEIHASGGGILSTVRATREASQPDLVDAHARGTSPPCSSTARRRSRSSRATASTPRPSSSMLRAIQEAGYESAAHVVATCLAAHAVPEDAESADAYITLCIDEILPAGRGVGARRGRRRVLRARRVRRRAVAALSRGGARARPRAAPARRPVRRDRRARARDRARSALDRPSRGDGRRGRRQARRLRRRRRRAADRRADARAPAAAGARARRRRRPAGARDRLQSRARAPATRCPPSCTWPARSATSRPPRRSRP